MCNKPVPSFCVLSNKNGEQSLFRSDCRYVIPIYQRDYAWKEDQIQQLVTDIADFSEEKYYLGSLVVHKTKDKFNTFEVVDGQQRLITLFLLLNSLSIIAREKNLPLNHPDILPDDSALTFDRKDATNASLKTINAVARGLIKISDLDQIQDPSIQSGYTILKQEIEQKIADFNRFLDQLGKTILYRVEVPEKTNLNQYFEVMNTRGEQLEQIDIVKATLMSHITGENQDGENKAFATVWNACRRMDRYIQMNFKPEQRSVVFANDGVSLNNNWWKELLNKKQDTDSKGKNVDNQTIQVSKQSILNILNSTDIDTSKSSTQSDIDETGVYKSIIDFPHFLLHALKLFVQNKVKDKDPLSSLIPETLDEAKIEKTFKKVLSKVEKEKLLNTDNEGPFPIAFIKFLLQIRLLFDSYIVKQCSEDKNSQWTIRKFTGIDKEGSQFTNTFNENSDSITKIQSCLRVSYTSPKSMHWITTLLQWLYQNQTVDENEIEKTFLTQARNIARKAVRDENIPSESDGVYNKGCATPHIVLNYLDFLLWEENKENYSDFQFEFRSSIEHWYPRHPEKDPWEAADADRFGNLCLMHQSTNAHFSNLYPTQKNDNTNQEKIKNGSLKLRIMSEITTNEKKWDFSEVKSHEEKMIELLKEDCNKPRDLSCSK